mgnify:FL=1
MAVADHLQIDDTVTISSAGFSPASPLIVALHGYGASEQDLVGLRVAYPAGVATACLRAPLTLGPGSYAWLPITTIGNPDVAAVDAAASALLSWLETNAGERPVILLGFSQGSTVALQALRQRPEAISAVVVLSGFSVPAPHDGDAHLAKQRPPVFFGHGDVDPVIPLAVSERTADWLEAHSTLTRTIYPGLPHAISSPELRDVNAFLHGVLQPGSTT